MTGCKFLKRSPGTEEVDVCNIPTGEVGGVHGCDKGEEELPTLQSYPVVEWAVPCGTRCPSKQKTQGVVWGVGSLWDLRLNGPESPISKILCLHVREWQAGGGTVRLTTKSGNKIVETVISGQRPPNKAGVEAMQTKTTTPLCSPGWPPLWPSTSAQWGPSVGFRLPKIPWKCWQPEKISFKNTRSRD